MRKSGLSILVADDQHSQRMLLVHVLGTMGYECDTAVDGRDCLAKIAGKTYHIVFLDLVMPEVDGEMVLRYLRINHPRTSVVVSSVQDDEGIIRDLLALGATAYLVKPFTSEEIRGVMNGIENRRTQAGLHTVAL